MGKWSTEQWTLRTWAWESGHWTGVGTAQIKVFLPGDTLRLQQGNIDDRRPQQRQGLEYRPSVAEVDAYHSV